MTVDKDLATILAAHEQAHKLGILHPHLDEMIKRLESRRKRNSHRGNGG